MGCLCAKDAKLLDGDGAASYNNGAADTITAEIFVDDGAAVRRIQATWRGKSARLEREKKKKAATSIQAQWRGNSSRNLLPDRALAKQEADAKRAKLLTGDAPSARSSGDKKHQSALGAAMSGLMERGEQLTALSGKAGAMAGEAEEFASHATKLRQMAEANASWSPFSGRGKDASEGSGGSTSKRGSKSGSPFDPKARADAIKRRRSSGM